MKLHFIQVLILSVMFSACGEKDMPNLADDKIYPYEFKYSGYCFHDHLYQGDTTIKFEGMDTINFKVTLDYIQLSGKSYSYKFKNEGNELSANDGGYISAAGGFWWTKFIIKEDSLLISSRSGNSFSDRYNFGGKKF